MPTIRLHPSGDTLTFDLKDVLASMGPHGSALFWTVGGVASHVGGLDATGEGAHLLENLAKSGERVPSLQLAQIANTTQQVIWGEFQGFTDEKTDVPKVFVRAIDSSWWEVQSNNAPLLNRVSQVFSPNVERMDLVYTLHHIRGDDEYGDDAKLIGVYRSRESAEAAVARLRDLLGFRDHPAGFEIDEYQLDMDHWTEGFVSTAET